MITGERRKTRRVLGFRRFYLENTTIAAPSLPIAAITIAIGKPSGEAMDPLLAPWIAELLLTLPDADDRLVASLLATIPSPSRHPALRKRLLLRQLRSDPAASERSLEALELLGDLDGAASPALAAAYAAVAANCSVRRVREGRGSEEAVRSLWRRVGDAARGRAGLRSPELEKWEGLLEKALRDGNTRRLVLCVDTERKAADAVEDYVHEALREIGRPMLEVAAMEFLSRRVGMGAGSAGASASGSPAVVAGGEEAASEEIGVPGIEVDVEARPGGRVGEGVGRADAEEAAPEEIGDPMLEVAVEAHPSGVIGEGVGRADVEEAAASEEIGVPRIEVAIDGHPSGMVGVGVGRADVEVAASGEIGVPMLEVAVDGQPSRRTGEDVGLVDVDVDAQHTEEVQEKNGADREHGLSGNKQQSPSPDVVEVKEALVTSSTNLHDVCGDDFVELASDGSQDSPMKSRLRSLRKRKLALSNPSDVAKSPRRPRKKWTELEENVLCEAVAKFGAGKWKAIHNCHLTVFEGRTEVDLKDKWRNMTRSG